MSVTLALLAAVIAADPDSAISADRMAELRATLDQAEGRWRTQAPTSYSYQLVAGSVFTRSTYVIKVNGDACEAKSRENIGKKVSKWKPVPCKGYLIQDIFTELRRQLSFPQERVELTFHAGYGFPIKASFQPHSDIPDQDEYFEISAFKTLAADEKSGAN